MTGKRIGQFDLITTTAARDVSSGHLHIAPDGRTGIYLGSEDVASGDPLVLHMNERVELDATVPLVSAAAGATVNFNYTTQKIVASGGTNVGKYLEAKATDATTGKVILNAGGATA